MKRYFFKITSARFTAPKEVEYNELEHKILNEKIKDIEIIVLAEKIEDTNIKVEETLKEIISSQLLDFPLIKFYKFGVKTDKIEELS